MQRRGVCSRPVDMQRRWILKYAELRSLPTQTLSTGEGRVMRPSAICRRIEVVPLDALLPATVEPIPRLLSELIIKRNYKNGVKLRRG